MTITYKNSVNGSRSVIHANANQTIVVVGNNTVSNLTSNSSELVVSASLSKAWWGSQGGTWIVQQGNSSANAISAVFNDSGFMHFDQGGTLIDANKTGTNMYLTLVGTANGFIQLELKKNC